ncbi:aminopeptidase N [Hamadaea tsunoensis]|uniref:aminopeptidase N n=1 Tax=Hamadaea tsunoensis TaxID=53368 RepID=UPI000415813C|nr:aminopeptidase N [Hamadaea tsunoensis]
MTVKSLTQAEAQERAALLSVEAYAIEVDFTGLIDGSRVACVSTVTFTCREPGATTFVDCAAEVVGGDLNGAPLPPARDGRIELTGLAEHNVLRVHSVQDNTRDGEGVHKAVDPADGEVYVWTSFEPDEARHVWACFDQPDLKATHALTVTAPAHWTITSNSGNPAVEPVDGGRRWSFAATPALSTYNIVVNGGPFATVRREAGGYDLGIHARKSLAAVLERDADEVFRVTEQGLAFFGRVFGMPFPQKIYDQVFMPEFGGAMENYGCVTWSDMFLRRSTPTYAENESFARVLLHEMAHMWFGNIVTMRWWDDLWLNEAFAEFAAYWAATRATEYTDARAGFAVSEKLSAYLADQGPTSHPIRLPIHDVAQAMSIFDSITYPKGASVLYQLMCYVGEENFIQGMTAYFARYAWSNTTLQDLVDSLSAHSGRDLDTWRRGWLETAGTDRITLRRTDSGLVLDATGPDGGPRPQVLAVAAYERDGERLRRSAYTEVELTGVETTVDLALDADFYLVNDDDLTFATTRPDDLGALVATAPQLPSALSRAVAGSTVWDMLTTGDAGAADAVACLTGLLDVEASDAVVERYLVLATEAAELWAADRQRPDLMAVVAAASRDLADRPAVRRPALRAFARMAPTLEDVAWLREQAGDDVDLHWRALVRQAELGGSVATDIAELRERDTDPDAWVRAVAVAAALPDPEEKANAWSAMIVERSLPIASTLMVSNAFWRPGQDEILRPYLDRYIDALPEMHKGGMIPAMYFTGRLFPVYALDEAYLDRVASEAASAAPVVAKTAAERVDFMRRVLRSRA